MYLGVKQMIKRCIKRGLIVACLLNYSVGYAQQAVFSYVEEARGITQQFQQTLKHELQAAIKTGGLKKAVDVCSIRAPEIAEEITAETGWTIGRTSLKTRNPKNRPTAQEKEVLDEFASRKSAGEDLAKMEWGQQQGANIRYMKTIPMKGLCLNCHGMTVDASLKNHIKELYPLDTATGFKIGDIRGAFSLQKYIELPNGQIIK